MLSLAVHAKAQYITIPFTPQIADEVTMAENDQCDTEAHFSEASFEEARTDISLVGILSQWDAYELTKEGQEYSKAELARYRGLTAMAWQLANKYPMLDSVNYGDEVFDACINSKITTLTPI